MLLPSSQKKLDFIVATPADRGGWYKEKKETFSLINSHVARTTRPSRKATRIRKGNASTRIPPVGPLSVRNSETDASGSLYSTVQSNSQHADNQKRHSTHTLPCILVAPDVNLGVAEGVTWDVVCLRKDNQWSPCTAKPPHRFWTGVMDTPGRAPSVRSILARNFSKSQSHGNDNAPFIGQPIRVPWEISSGTFPFMRLAVEISSSEEHLLRFFVSQGSMLMYGCTDSDFDPSLRIIHQGVFQRNSVFVETHLVIAEQMLSQMRGSQLSNDFYRRRANSYRSVVDWISKPDSILGELLEAMLGLLVSEFVSGRLDLVLYHLQAMDKLVQSQGGLSFLLRPDVPVELGCYSNLYLTVEFPTPLHGMATELVILGFIDSLRQIRRWIVNNQQDFDLALRSGMNDSLGVLRLYLHHGVERYVSDITAPYHRKSGYFYILLHSCITMVEFDFDSDTAIRFLELIQQNLAKSIRMRPGQHTSREPAITEQLDKLLPVYFPPLLPHITREVLDSNFNARSRSHVFEARSMARTRSETELAIAESSVNALKAFAMIGMPTRMRLCQDLLQCFLSSCNAGQMDCLREEELTTLATELRDREP